MIIPEQNTAALALRESLVKLYDAFHKYDWKTDEQFDAMDNAARTLYAHQLPVRREDT